MENRNTMNAANTDTIYTVNANIADTDTIHTEIVNTEIADLKNLDIRTIQPEELADIEKIEIDKNLPVEERMREFIRQIKNPYFFRCGKFIVQVEYSNTNRSINDCLKEFMDNQMK